MSVEELKKLLADYLDDALELEDEPPNEKEIARLNDFILWLESRGDASL